LRTARLHSGDGTIPAFSCAMSMPVVFPKPKARAASASPSMPTRFPIV